MQWYYARGGQQFGPVEETEIRLMAADGRLQPSDLVWNQTFGSQWQRASSVEGLFVGTAAVPPALATVPGTGGQTPNHRLMAQARERLCGRWGTGVVAMLIYLGISTVCAMLPVLGAILSWLVAGPIELGLAILFLAMARGQYADIGMMFQGFRRFGTAFLYMFVTSLLTGLGLVLLIVPGLILACGFALGWLLLADNPALGVFDAMGESWRRMRGFKWKFFCLNWRFLGWILLTVLTCGLGSLWLVPYMTTTFARFYDDLSPEPASVAAPQP